MRDKSFKPDTQRFTTLSIKATVKDTLKCIAEARGVSMSKLIAYFIDEYVEDYQRMKGK